MAAATRASLRTDLRALANEPVPEPRPAFLAEVEARLHDSVGGGVADIDDAPFGRSRRRVPAVLAGALALVVAIVVVAFGLNGVGPAERIQTTPANLGGGGSAPEVAGGGGNEAGNSRSPSVLAGHASSAGEGKGSGRTGSTGATAGGTEKGGSSTSSSEQYPASADAANKSTTAARTEFELRGSGTPARVFLDWDGYRGDDFAAYLVLRSIAPDEPDYPADSQKTLIMLRVENRDTTTYQDTPKVGSTCRYRIVVVDRDGRELARSNVVEPTTNPAPPKTTADLPSISAFVI